MDRERKRMENQRLREGLSMAVTYQHMMGYLQCCGSDLTCVFDMCKVYTESIENEDGEGWTQRQRGWTVRERGKGSAWQ